MIYKEHYIELYINGHKMDLESQKSLNLRFNNVLFDPEKISSTQAEYSFSFELPSTPNNDKAFDYANNLSKLNRFHQRWNAEVYADGEIIFEGTLTLNGYKEKKYQCNLVSVKVYSLDEIFGESVMTDMDWYIPFDGAGDSGYTVNSYNELLSSDVRFPFVSYGAFQKSPYNSDNVANDYTSKFDLDKYNRWYIESFYPSLKMLETLKRTFEHKGYRVGGDVFNDNFLQDIYMSTNLADEQDPLYNLAHPKFGSVNLSTTVTTSGSGYGQELNWPYFRVHNARGHFGNGDSINTNTTEAYNWEEIDIYDALEGSVTVASPSYMYQPNEHLIIIPADGWYKIDMEVSSTLNTTGNITVGQNCITNGGTGNDIEVEDVSIPVGLLENTPVEIQLVRNYDDNIELIKGKNNKSYKTGNPTSVNYTEWLTCFPHENIYNSTYPTKNNDLTSTLQYSRFKGERGSVQGISYNQNDYGYVYKTGEIMAYDPAVNPDFICGFSSLLGGTASVRKNGYSWSRMYSEKVNEFYNNTGYNKLTKSGNAIIEESTTFGSNTYLNAPQTYVSSTNSALSGRLSAMVWLNKNDMLNLMVVHRKYYTEAGNEVWYSTTDNVSLSIKAASPYTYGSLIAKNYNYYSDSEFDYDLRLSNFLNKEKKMSEWVENILDAYNLEVTQDGRNVYINKRKKYNFNIPVAIDIDDRVNSNNADSTAIEYPESMAVRYKIDTDEWGFERSAVLANGGDESVLNDPEWEKYGESGFTVIKLNDDSYVTDKSEKNLQFSYTWYDNFNWYPVDSGFTQDSGATPVTLRIPVISKYSYMIDGYDYDESMKHDGYGLSQRFWWVPKATGCYVWTRTYPAERIWLYEPTNLWTNYRDVYLNLSYKTNEMSLLKQYFNITPYLASNFVKVDVYLTPQEYKSIKNGCLVKFDSDLYIPVEISGYDPAGANVTELKMMKKIQ